MGAPRFGLFLDLGEVEDYTCLSIFEIERVDDHNEYDCVTLERARGNEIPPYFAAHHRDGDAFYDTIFRAVLARMLNPPLMTKDGPDCYLGIDITGVGRTVFTRVVRSMFQSRDFAIYPLQIRHLVEVKPRQGDDSVIQVSREDLLAITAYVMDKTWIRIPNALALAIEARKELKAVTKKPKAPTGPGNAWRQGVKDDIPLSIGGNVWLAERLGGQGVGGIVRVQWKGVQP